MTANISHYIGKFFLLGALASLWPVLEGIEKIARWGRAVYLWRRSRGDERLLNWMRDQEFLAQEEGRAHKPAGFKPDDIARELGHSSKSVLEALRRLKAAGKVREDKGANGWFVC